ncbi:MAG: tRNA uridine-5-carboxymethylaminomethyl(34) synthesis GTPase MnmE [Tatlockia sp.]|nr:tRNA uridine-5-carboxymethylaminomethyl(34) synthesis GTPase MnmE [Tatlockia sp.]
MQDDTIAAIATPPGRGGVGIVRLSGALAYSIALQLNGAKALNPRVAYYGPFLNRLNEIIDQGLLIYFKAPHSFTGEDIVEFHGHGSPIILDILLKEVLFHGARLAKPGEFSERAYLNDKMDLTQAEAVADLINASSETAAKMAIRTLQGDFSRKIFELNENLIHLRIFVEAAIDFPEEEIDFLNDGKVATQLSDILNQLNQIRANATQGAMMREGLSVVIAGRPNAGKSTLINCLAGRDVAIVTEVAGTTRDVMREHILLDDIPLHIVDTAGLRESSDLVEKEGIKRAWQEVSQADCLLIVTDINFKECLSELNEEIRNTLPPHVPVIQIFNKIDSLNQNPEVRENTLYLSAKCGLGLDLLKDKIKELVGYQPTEGQFLARRRHLQALDKAKDLLEDGKNQLIGQRAGELLAEDLRLAHQVLGEITGEFSSDDLLGKIFSSFCIGK